MSIKNWSSWKLEDCCEILDNKRIPINAEEREKRIGIIPYYGANGIQGFIDDFLFDEPLILIAEDGGQFDEFATRPIAYRINGKSWVNNHAHVLRAKTGFFQDTIFYALEHKDIQPFIVGGTRAKLNQKALRSIEISLPSDINEQTKIAEVLSTVDKAISETEALIAKQQRIKTGLMQDLLTRGIDEKGNLRSEETHQFKDSPLGRIPIEWDITSISKIATDITSGSRWWAKYYSEEGAIFIRIGNLTREHINLRLDSIQYVAPPESAEKNRTLVKEGDLLISVTADLGIIGVIKEEFPEAYINQHIALIRLNKTINPRFVGHYLASFKGKEQFDHFNESGAKAGLNLPTVGKLCITKPNIKEQIQISKLLYLIDHKILESKFDLQKLQRLKTGLMQDLLTGKKRVTPLLENNPIS